MRKTLMILTAHCCAFFTALSAFITALHFIEKMNFEFTGWIMLAGYATIIFCIWAYEGVILLADFLKDFDAKPTRK